jgi:hypothetical protein
MEIPSYAENREECLLPIMLGSFLLYRDEISETLLTKMKMFSNMRISFSDLVQDYLYNIDPRILTKAILYYEKEYFELSVIYKSIIYFLYSNYGKDYFSQYSEERFLKIIDNNILPMDLSYVLEHTINIKRAGHREICVVQPHGRQQYYDLKRNDSLKSHIQIFAGSINNPPELLDRDDIFYDVESGFINCNHGEEIETTFLNLTWFMLKNKLFGDRVKRDTICDYSAYLILHSDFEVKSIEKYISDNIHRQYYTVYEINEVNPIKFNGPRLTDENEGHESDEDLVISFPEPKMPKRTNMLTSIMPLDKKYLGLHMLSTGFCTKIDNNYFVGSFRKINTNFKYEKGRIKFQEQIVPEFCNYSNDGVRSI